MRLYIIRWMIRKLQSIEHSIQKEQCFLGLHNFERWRKDEQLVADKRMCLRHSCKEIQWRWHDEIEKRGLNNA